MCRLFGLSGGSERVQATFWLLDAPDSLAAQSRREPDGTGLGTFDADGTPRVDKQPIAAYQDRQFAQEAKERVSTTFIAHIRYASTGGLSPQNTHPFEQRGRLFAHNGVIADLPRLEAELGDYRSLVRGDTDSERFFALITRHIDAGGGDIGAGIASAARWVAAHVPIYAINIVLTTPTELFALRYPDTHDLLVLHRRAGGQHGNRHLEQASAAGRIRVRSGALATTPAVVIASERMDEDPEWRSLSPGELIHVDRHLQVHSTIAVEHPPTHQLTLDDLGHGAASQKPG
ncbi:MAG: class II glutamine amidotransferase [Pseudonocardiaceae bacterium]